MDYKSHYKNGSVLYEDYGNFNFGAVGTALGFPEWLLLREAGRKQMADGHSLPEWGNPGPLGAFWAGSGSFGDEPIDQYWIDG